MKMKFEKIRQNALKKAIAEDCKAIKGDNRANIWSKCAIAALSRCVPTIGILRSGIEDVAIQQLQCSKEESQGIAIDALNEIFVKNPDVLFRMTRTL